MTNGHLKPHPNFHHLDGRDLFAKLKTLIRRAAERTIDGLQERIGDALKAFSQTECANYFRHAGYA